MIGNINSSKMNGKIVYSNEREEVLVYGITKIPEKAKKF